MRGTSPVVRRLLEPIVFTVVGLLVAAILTGPALSQLEYRLTDLRFAVRRAVRSNQEYPVAVLLIDRDTERAVGRPYDSSWRSEYPALIQTLGAAGAVALVFDAVFVSAEPELDAALLPAFSGPLPVVAGVTSDTRPATTLADADWLLGSLEVLAIDSVPRRTLPVRLTPAAADANTVVPPISVIAADLYHGDAGGRATDGFLIDYGYSLEEIPTFNLADVLGASEDRLADARRTPLSIFDGRLVLMGTDLPGVDRYPIPGSGGERRPGVFAQTTATLTAIHGTQTTTLDRPSAILFASLTAAAAAVAVSLRRRRMRRIATAAVAVVALVVPIALFAAAGIELHFVAILAGMFIPLAAGAALRRYRVSRSYATSLGFDPELIASHSVGSGSDGEPIERSACVLCADVRDFTQFVTDNDPVQVHTVMDQYMRAMEQTIDAEGGYVNKYVGDEIIAIVGFPKSESDMVTRGLRMAMAMLEQLELLKAQWHLEDLPVLEAIGIGLDFGTLRFSHFGGKKRVQFDVLGNAINGASRLQSIAKEHDTPLVVPDSIAEHQSVIPLADTDSDHGLSFIGEVMIRGQGRRRVYGLK